MNHRIVKGFLIQLTTRTERQQEKQQGNGGPEVEAAADIKQNTRHISAGSDAESNMLKPSIWYS